MKPMDYWTLECHTMSLQEGWLLTNYDGCQQGKSIVAICKLDDPSSAENLDYENPKFKCDETAADWVLRKAISGNIPHLLAVWLSGHAIEEEMLLDLPDFFTV